MCIVDDIEENLRGMYDIDVVISQIEDRLIENEELLGVEIIPIAVLFAGDFLCLDYREQKDEPIVCICSH